MYKNKFAIFFAMKFADPKFTKRLTLFFIFIGILAYFSADAKTGLLFFASVAIGAIVWFVSHRSQNLIFRALANTIFPVIVGLSVLSIVLVCLNVFGIYSPKENQIRSLEELPMDLSLWIKKWFKLSYWQFAAILIGLFILNIRLPKLKLTSQFIRHYRLVNYVSIFLLTVTSFTFFSKFPNEQVLEKGYQWQVQKYKLLVDRNKDEVAKYLAAKMQAVAIEQMKASEKKKVKQHFERSRRKIDSAYQARVHRYRIRVEQKVAKDLHYAKHSAQSNLISFQRRGRLNKIVKKRGSSSNISPSDREEAQRFLLENSSDSKAEVPAYSPKRKHYTSANIKAYNEKLSSRMTDYHRVPPYQQAGEEIASLASEEIGLRIEEELLTSAETPISPIAEEVVKEIENRAGYDANLNLIKKTHLELGKNQRLANEATVVLEKLVSNAFGFESIGAEEMGNSFFKKVVRSYTERVFRSQVVDRLNLKHKLEQVDWSLDSYKSYLSWFNPSTALEEVDRNLENSILVQEAEEAANSVTKVQQDLADDLFRASAAKYAVGTEVEKKAIIDGWMTDRKTAELVGSSMDNSWDNIAAQILASISSPTSSIPRRDSRGGDTWHRSPIDGK